MLYLVHHYLPGYLACTCTALRCPLNQVPCQYYNIILCRTMPYNTTQYHTLCYTALHYNKTQYNTGIGTWLIYVYIRINTHKNMLHKYLCRQEVFTWLSIVHIMGSSIDPSIRDNQYVNSTWFAVPHCWSPFRTRAWNTWPSALVVAMDNSGPGAPPDAFLHVSSAW